ncbi:MAG: TetR family transcriptional regulator [Candidatus Limnocylindria bacterium]
MRPYVQRARADRRERTGAAIERAALRELGIRGYADLRLADVARRAAVALRTVYLHAPTKEALVTAALRRRALILARKVERWRPPDAAATAILDDLVGYHERTYRSDRQVLELLVDSGAPGSAELLRSLDRARLALIERAMVDMARRGVLRMRAEHAAALAHALLAYPTWRAALTGPAKRRAPALIADALRRTLLASS